MTGRPSVIYILKDKFQFYSSLDGKIYEFRFVPEVIRDLDVVNGGLLENLIKVFITNTKLPPSNIVIVLADSAYFTKDFVIPPQQKPATNQRTITRELLQKNAGEFVEHVPFDNVVSKIIPIKDGLKVCATNKDFYEAIAITLEHMGFVVECVVPGIVLGNGLSLRPILDPAMANLILQKINGVKEYNMLGQKVFQPEVKQETEEVDEVELERMQSKKPNKKRLYGMVGLLGSLIIVLVIVFVQNESPATTPKPDVSANVPNPTPLINKPVVLATIIPTTEFAVSPNLTATQNLTVEIVNTSPSGTIAQELQGDLDTYKFKSVSLQTQSPIGSSGSLVSFAPDVDQNTKDAVIAEMKKYESNVIVQDQKVGNFDISIILGQ